MTTLKELFMSRACKIGLAVMLAASMVPVAALSSAPAFAEDVEAEQAAAVSEPVADEQPASPAESDDTPAADTADEPIEAREAFAAEGDEQPESEPVEATDDVPVTEEEAVEEPEEELSVSDLQLESLETTVEEPFSVWAPFRLLFGADNTFNVPLKSGSYTNWIDRLDLSGAPYARNFYNILVEAADNDKTSDWLIENKGFTPAACTILSTSAPASRATVGNVYKVNSSTSGILAAIVDDADAATANSELTATEQRVKQYINETYGAFDRDYPTSFWRDVSFGTVFVRDKSAKKTLCFFALKGDGFDLRAQGYRSANDIRAGIDTIDQRVEFINQKFEESDLPNKGTDYARVKFYNQWICENNQYNTKFNSVANNATKLKEFQAANPDVWSAMSALSGRRGETGPVCEGYSRALKLLCDVAGIGCVLVDGNTTAGAHMWNYVRIGSKWYGVDITWNNNGNKADYERYLLVGANTVPVGSSPTFLNGHPVSNQFVSNGTKFTNGPALSADAYDPNNVAFTGIITTSDTFAYGDSFALGYSSTTQGTASYSVTGPATIAETNENTLAQVAAVGTGPMLTITGMGDITVTVTLTLSSDSSKKLTDSITVKGVARPLKVTGTELATRMYDGTLDATVLTAGSLVSARSASYASVGLLQGDTVGVTVKSARYTEGTAGINCPGTATYELSGDAATLQKYTLASDTDTTATGTITKRPATGYFALESTRVLLGQEQPKGTVRYEEFTTEPEARGVVEGDDLVPTDLNMQLTGLPTPLTPGTYMVHWSNPTAVLAAINELPAASNYDITLANGAADESVQLEVVDLRNTVIIPAQDAESGKAYRVEARVNGINDETVAKLVEVDPSYSDTTNIVAKLLETLKTQTTNLDGGRIAVYDMTLFVKDENNRDVPVTKENFPKEGVRVTLNYPENTGKDSHSFYAAHMFTTEVESDKLHKPGEVEAPEVTNEANGMSFKLMGFSPVSVAWEEVRTPQNADGTPNGAPSTTPVGQTTQQTGASAISQTGDSLPVVGITVIALACAALIVVLLVRRGRDKKGDQKR